ncbi:LysR family transcriptional regulator [Pigmentiphaga aceris]|uniref:LysR family transcriptional regulator n=1 Tax=Pigmentiphaga aceris TaxID=1940612 RepID=A0A5C0ARP1_9BURK|nr:LysR family transcriptional regulator [Pigmentiphaga aceris]QEI04635.1 LysR family transcriptional regulator [Pigmentiphaga aceris]
MDQLLALRVFVRIAEAGTFVRAAESLNLPKPTVTKLVQSLEAHLGAKLLQRTTRRVSVTPEGAAYYERARVLIAQLEEMDATASSTRTSPSGRLRVDIGSSLANVILIPALPDFRARYPDIQLEIGVSDRPVDLIGDAIDCVIRGGELADSTLVAKRIAELDYVTCASPDYLARFGTPRHPAELETGHQLLNYFSSLSNRPFAPVFVKAGERLETAAQAAVAVNESTAHVTALLAGLGIGQTFRFIVQPLIDAGALVPVLTDWSRPKHPLFVVYPQNRHLSARLRVFVCWVAEVFDAIQPATGTPRYPRT